MHCRLVVFALPSWQCPCSLSTSCVSWSSASDLILVSLLQAYDGHTYSEAVRVRIRVRCRPGQEVTGSGPYVCSDVLPGYYQPVQGTSHTPLRLHFPPACRVSQFPPVLGCCASIQTTLTLVRIV